MKQGVCGGFMQKVLLLISLKTTFPPANRAALGSAVNVYAGICISGLDVFHFLFLIPNSIIDLNAVNKAVVPELKLIACFTPIYLAKKTHHNASSGNIL